MRADAIVVLGAAVNASGEAGPAMRRRVEHGVRLLLAGRAPRLVLSGGHGGGGPAEAEVMARIAAAAGVGADRLVLEDRSRNTFENALYTGHIMRERGWRRLLLVTDLYHLPRALYVFRRLGLSVSGDAVRDRGGDTRLRWYGGWLREPFALAKSAWLFRLGRHEPLVRAVWGT